MTAEEQDVIQQINGKFGIWQLRTIVLIFLCKIPTAWFMACVIYTAPTPQKGEYYCKSIFNNKLSFTWKLIVWRIYWFFQIGADALEDVEEALQGTDRQFDVCNVPEALLEKQKYVTNLSLSMAISNMHDEGAAVVPCKHFEHNTEYHSLVTQFDLVCSRQLLVSLSQGSHALGALVGGILAYHILKLWVI